MGGLSAVRRVCLAGLLVLMLVGCGSSSATLVNFASEVVSSSCHASGASGPTQLQACDYVLGDGRRFSCPHQLTGASSDQLTGASLDHALQTADCRKLPQLKISAAQRTTFHAVGDALACLRLKGLRANGGPVLPDRTQTPDGEVVIASAHPTFIAFYISVAKARRLEVTVRRNVQRTHGLVERHAAVTIAWTAAPNAQLRHTIESCVFS